ncbi:unnamed protein product [Lasius platythorax]|uniref:Uncharacterized protein n=1 Tax=Lasius platythorax TaxID=488582 RepID=A0AAV2N0U6_9HYME
MLPGVFLESNRRNITLRLARHNFVPLLQHDSMGLTTMRVRSSPMMTVDEMIEEISKRCCQLQGIRMSVQAVRRDDTTRLPHLSKPAYQ